LHSEGAEHEKFKNANAKARSLGLSILKLFSYMIPVITFTSSMGTLLVVTLGGYYVTTGAMTLGSFAAFNSYIIILIFPILIIGFMSNIIAQAAASYARIHQVLETPEEKDEGRVTEPLRGAIAIKDVTVTYGEKPALKNVSAHNSLPHTKTAIIGPTALAKTQLLNVATGLPCRKAARSLYDGRALSEYERASFYPQIGLVFQDSVLFNTTVREISRLVRQ